VLERPLVQLQLASLYTPQERRFAEGLALGMELLTLGLCAFALTRPRARRFLQARASRRGEP